MRKVLKEERYRGVRDVGLFIVITVGIHFCYRFWISVGYWPIGGMYERVIGVMQGVVVRQSYWLIVHVVQPHTVLQGIVLWFPNQMGISINESCTGLKQMVQVLLLFLIYPGPWRHKVWFIPAGLVVIHFTNIVRIGMLAFAMNLNFPHIHFIHNEVLRGFFYVVIFGMWVVWEEVLKGHKVTE